MELILNEVIHGIRTKQIIHHVACLNDFPQPLFVEFKNTRIVQENSHQKEL